MWDDYDEGRIWRTSLQEGSSEASKEGPRRREMNTMILIGYKLSKVSVPTN